ncbi:MAG TPA: hypothetical protein DGG95_11575 [Cytophagales bacterium]|nr:hypothetical protein [Cytophagales bacterium]
MWGQTSQGIPKNYSQVKLEFPHSLTDHFPNEFKTLGQIEAVTPGGAYAYNMAFLCLSLKADSTELIDLEARLKKASAKQFSPSDTSLIIVGDTVDYSKKINGTPIPSFSLYEKDFGLNSVRLDKDFSIYVLESKRGEYMIKENLTTKNKVPDNWKNGFSRGLAINKEKKEVLYWLTMW